MTNHSTQSRRDFLKAALVLPAAGSTTFLQNGEASAAELKELTIARAFGLVVLPLLIMEHDQILERHAKDAGVGEVKVRYVGLGTGDALTTALISGSVQIAAMGVPPMIQLWDKTKSNIGVKCIASMSNLPMYLNTRDDHIKTIEDFTRRNRIAVAAVKTSIQAILLQMAAARAFGEDQFQRLDSLTVTLSQPEAARALLSGLSEIDSHFASPPYHYLELQDPKIHSVITSAEILGGMGSLTIPVTTEKFYAQNTKLYRAFFSGLTEAIDGIKKDKQRTATVYLEMTKDKIPHHELVKLLDSPDFVYSLTPQSVTKYAQFMHQHGAIKNKPGSWKDLFFPDVHRLAGS